MEFNPEKIEEAVVVTDEQKAAAKTETTEDLLQQLAAATEKKTPAEKGADAWKFDDEAEDEEEPAADNKAEESSASPGSAKDPKAAADKPATKDEKLASARIAVGMMDLTFKSLFTPLINHRFKKKFTVEEIDRLETVADADKKKLTDEDLDLRNKWDRLMKKRDQKLETIPIEGEEKDDLETAMYTYFDVTGKKLSPEWFVGMALIRSLGNRCVDTFTD
jgi:hypothetical protein